jgi:hypothetical protein
MQLGMQAWRTALLAPHADAPCAAPHRAGHCHLPQGARPEQLVHGHNNHRTGGHDDLSSAPDVVAACDLTLSPSRAQLVNLMSNDASKLEDGGLPAAWRRRPAGAERMCAPQLRCSPTSSGRRRSRQRWPPTCSGARCAAATARTAADGATQRADARQIGWSCLVGLFVLALLIPIQVRAALMPKAHRSVIHRPCLRVGSAPSASVSWPTPIRQARRRRETVAQCCRPLPAQRVKIVNEILVGCEVMKLYAWEESLEVRAHPRLSLARRQRLARCVARVGEQKLVSKLRLMEFASISKAGTLSAAACCCSLRSG